MSSIIKEFKQKTDFYSEKGASEDTISDAEKALKIQFAPEYKEYLREFGSVSCGGHELTGISADENLDVVGVTKHNLEKNPNIKMPLYVIEETHVDGIVIWQSHTGEVFQSEYKGTPVKIFQSLTDYVATFTNRPVEG